MRTTKVKLGAGLAVALLAAGCGDDSTDKVAEKIAEKAIEKAAENGGSSGDVDVDISKDGGQVKVKSKDGDTTFESGGDLPEWLSDDVPIPAGAEVNASLGSADGSYVSLTTEGEVKDVFEKFKADLTGKGIDLAGEPTIMESGGKGMYALEFVDKNGKVVVTFTSGDENQTIVQIALAPETAGE